MTSTKNVDYKALQAELDELLDKLQHDELDIDAAVAAYERGMEIVKQIEAYLREAENKVTKLQAKFGE